MTAPDSSVRGATPPAGAGALVRGSFWLVIMGIASRALGVVGTLVLTHLVAPDAYGEVSDASVVAFTLNVVGNVGVGVWVIANPRASDEEMFHGAVLHITLGALLLLPLPLFGGLLGHVFGAPTMGRYLPGMAAAVLLERFTLLPERILMSSMRFSAVSLARGIVEIIYTLVSVVGAALGLGAVAVVLGNLARSGSRVLVLLRMVSWRRWLRPHRLRAEVFRRIIRFGLPISLGQMLSFALRRWDNLVVSRLHGAAVVGSYNLAYNLADIPAVQVGEQITDALQVSFTGARDDDPRRRLMRSLAVLAFIMTPMAVGLGTLAATLAGTFLDRRWTEVGPMLMWLSIISFPRPLSGAVAAYMQVRNRRRAFLALEAFTLVTLLASLFTLGRLGPIQACIAVGATFLLRLGVAGLLLWRLDGVPLWDFFRPQVPPVIASAIMAAAVVGARLGLERLHVSGVLSLVTQISVGVVVYAGAARVVAPAAWRETIGLVRRALASRRRGPGAPAPT